jgi:hypothetical protein
MLSFNGLLVNAMKLEATENFTMAAIFLFPLKSNKSCILFKDVLQFIMYDQILSVTLISQVHALTTLLTTGN